MGKFQKFLNKWFPKFYHDTYCGNAEYTFPQIAKIDNDPSHRYPVICTKCGYHKMMSPVLIQAACFVRDHKSPATEAGPQGLYEETPYKQTPSKGDCERWRNRI